MRLCPIREFKTRFLALFSAFIRKHGRHCIVSKLTMRHCIVTLSRQCLHCRRACKTRCFCIFRLWRTFLIFLRYPKAPEVSKNLPRPGGFAVLQYGTVASHGDHIRARNYSFSAFLATLACAVLRNQMGPGPNGH